MNSLTVSQARLVRCSASQQLQQRQAAQPTPHTHRRQLLAGLAGLAGLAVTARPPAAQAGLSIESIDLPTVDVSEAVRQQQARNQAVLDEAETSFQNSDLLRSLKERSDANRDANKKALTDKYCMRQAELGVGDCGGLRYIPGMTKSGVQKRPEWLESWGKQLGLVKE